MHKILTYFSSNGIKVHYLTKCTNINRIFLKKKSYLCSKIEFVMNKDINRIKVVLAEKKRTNKWLAEQLGKDPATVSKWCTNTLQPNVETIVEIAKYLQVEIQELFWPIESSTKK